MTPLKTLLLRMIAAAPDVPDHEVSYIFEDTVVLVDHTPVDESHLQEIASAGDINQTVKPSKVIHVDCADSGDSFAIQLSNEGTVAVITAHQRDWFYDSDPLEPDESDGVGMITDQQLAGCHIDDDHTNIAMSMDTATPQLAYSLVSLFGKVLAILDHQRNQTEEGIL